MPSALVIGGTGPTGPWIVNGLIDRAYVVAVLHSGRHEVDFKTPVEHIHADPHFEATLREAIGGRSWDLVVASYGRLRVIVDVFKGRTGRLVAASGATGGTASADDPRWGAIGRPGLMDEDAALAERDVSRGKLAWRIAEAEAALFEAHRQAHYSVTLMAYPLLYGPRQPGALDWTIVRRALDGRKRFIIADGGIKLESRAFAANAAHATLLAIDQPQVSGGRKYHVADDQVYSLRQRIVAVAACLGHTFDFVDMPYELALPCHVLWRRTRESRLRDAGRIRRELGYRDQIPSAEGIAQTVAWMIANRAAMAQVEQQLGDPFDYEREDRLIAQWESAKAHLVTVDYPLPEAAHVYRHPQAPGEEWRRPRKEKDNADEQTGPDP